MYGYEIFLDGCKVAEENGDNAEFWTECEAQDDAENTVYCILSDYADNGIYDTDFDDFEIVIYKL